MRQNKISQEDQLRKIVESKIGKGILEYNQSKTYALCKEEEDSLYQFNRVLKFIVVRLNNMEVVYEGTNMPGYVKWRNDDEIELFDRPGIIKNDDDDMSEYKKIINIKTGQKSPIKSKKL